MPALVLAAGLRHGEALGPPNAQLKPSRSVRTRYHFPACATAVSKAMSALSPATRDVPTTTVSPTSIVKLVSMIRAAADSRRRVAQGFLLLELFLNRGDFLPDWPQSSPPRLSPLAARASFHLSLCRRGALPPATARLPDSRVGVAAMASLRRQGARARRGGTLTLSLPPAISNRRAASARTPDHSRLRSLDTVRCDPRIHCDVEQSIRLVRQEILHIRRAPFARQPARS